MLARCTVTEVKALYTKVKLEKLKELTLAFDTKTGGDGKLTFEEEKHEGTWGVAQDLLTSASGSMPVLALNTHYTSRSRRHTGGWKVTNFLPGCVEVPPPHSAASVFVKVRQTCSLGNLPLVTLTFSENRHGLSGTSMYYHIIYHSNSIVCTSYSI